MATVPSDAGMPEKAPPEKLREIVERVRTYHGTGSDDPYEALAVQPWAQIALHDADVLLLCDEITRLTREHDQAVQERNDLISAGGMLANVAFNLAQRKHLDADERETLDQCRRHWDAVRERQVQSRSPASPSPE